MGSSPAAAAAAEPAPRARRLSGYRAVQQRALDRYGILDSGRDDAYDDLAHLAAEACGCPYAGITFLDWSGARQFWKSGVGLPCSAATSIALPDAAAEAQNVCCQVRRARAPAAPRASAAPAARAAAARPRFSVWGVCPLVARGS